MSEPLSYSWGMGLCLFDSMGMWARGAVRFSIRPWNYKKKLFRDKQWFLFFVLVFAQNGLTTGHRERTALLGSLHCREKLAGGDGVVSRCTKGGTICFPVMPSKLALSSVKDRVNMFNISFLCFLVLLLFRLCPCVPDLFAVLAWFHITTFSPDCLIQISLEELRLFKQTPF